MTADFSKILGKKKDDIEDPKTLPQGHYIGVIEGRPKMGESREKKTPFATFTYLLQEATEDVDQDLLAAAGGVRKKDGTPRKLTQDFYITDEIEYQLRDFLNTLPIEWNTLGDAFEQVKGQRVLVQVEHEQEDVAKASPQRKAEIEAGDRIRTFVRVRKARGYNE